MMIHEVLKRSNEDSRVINLAGRQRMLSQRISKLNLIYSSNPAGNVALESLEESLASFEQVHQGLQFGDSELGLPPLENSDIREMFVNLQPNFEAIVKISRCVLEACSEKSSLMGQLRTNEESFLREMDRIVFAFDSEAQVKLSRVKNMELALFLFTLLVLLAELIFIFCPSIKEIKGLFREVQVEQARSLQAANLASIGEMASGMAHEINNPLALMKGHVHRLSRAMQAAGNQPEQANESVKKLNALIDRMGRIVQSLLALSRSDLPETYEDADVERLITDVQHLCSGRLKSKGVSFQVEIQEHLPLIRCMSLQVEQVLMNLVNNAVDALEETLSPTIKLKAFSDEKFVLKIQVEDNGSGVNKEKEGLIFQPFFTTKPVGKGTGLGLSISKSLIERQGGSLDYFRSSEETSIFEIQLPLQKPADEFDHAPQQDRA